MRSGKATLIGALAVLAIAGVSQAALVNLVGDPTFASGGVSSPWTGITRWYSGDTLTWMPNGKNNPPGEAGVSDTRWAAQLLNTEGPIRQTLGTTFKSGYTYGFSFWATHDNAVATTRYMRIGYMSSGSFVEVAKLTNAIAGANKRIWYKQSGSYVATAGVAGKTIVVSLEHMSNGGVTAWADDVILTEVPEPATMGLLALGGLALLRRRRR